MTDGLTRCWWSLSATATPDPRMVEYHDTEWGIPTHDDRELFERLALESFQAGLSWSTILNKRDAFRAAFRGFDPAVVAGFDDDDRARLMAAVTEADVIRILDRLAADMPTDREALKDFVASMVKQIALDPSNFTCRIHYEIPAPAGEFVASPRGFEPRLPP